MADSMEARIQLLRKFSPFDKIDNDILKPLSKNIVVKDAQKGFILFEKGDFDTNEYYLTKGSISQQASDGRRSIIKAGQPSSHFPIARLRPRMYTAKAYTDIQYFVISTSVLDEIQHSIQESPPELIIEETQKNANMEGHTLLHDFQQDLKSGRFVLPSLPEVAVKIRELILDPDVNMADIAKLVNTDTAIAAKLVRVANSVIYRGAQTCEDTLTAISRLGLTTTKQLVTSFAILAIFKAKSHFFKERMKQVWKKSIEVAAYSYVLASQLRGLNKEEALLAGLIHSVGEIVVLTYAERFLDLSKNEDILNTTLCELRGSIGHQVLEEWGFSEDLVIVAKEWSNWSRDNQGSFDYCDLVQVAILYVSKSDPNIEPLPDMTMVPAFKKLNNLLLCSEQISRMITQAQEQVAELRNIFI